MICGSPRFCEVTRTTLRLTPKDVFTCTSGERFRAAAKDSQKTGPYLIGPDVPDVAPINLAAALASDGYASGDLNREIYLLVDGTISGSLASRAVSAGVKRVLETSELSELAGQVGKATDAITHEGMSDSSGETKGVALSIMSGRGGCGKTTIALLSALSFSDKGFSVALLDLDLQFGDLSFLLHTDDAHDIVELAEIPGTASAIAGQLHIFEKTIAGEVAFFAAPRKPEDGDVVTPRLTELLEAFLSVYDITIINTGTFWDEAAAAIIKASTRIVLVTDQRMSSLDSCKRTLELCTRLGAPLARITACLNRYDPKGVVDAVNASIALSGIDHFTVADGGVEVEELISLGCPEDLFMLRNPCATSLMGSLEEMTPGLGLPLGGQHGKTTAIERHLLPVPLFRRKVRH